MNALKRFLYSSLRCCPLVWHFCNQKSSQKLKPFKKAFQFFQNGYESSYQDLLEKSNKSAVTIQRLRTLCLEAFKSFNHLNPSFRSNIFELKTSGTPNRSQQNLNLTHFIPVSHFYAHLKRQKVIGFLGV